MAVCTSKPPYQYYLTFSLFFVTVQSDRRGSLGSIYLHTILPHIQSFFFVTVQSDRRGSLGSMYVHTILPHIQSQYNQTEEVALAVFTSTSHSVTVQSDRRGSLGSIYLHTIKPHIQSFFCDSTIRQKR